MSIPRKSSSAALLAALTPLFAASLTGCGGGGSGSSSPLPRMSASTILPDGLLASVSENTSTISSSGTIVYTVKLTNNTASAITVAAYHGLGDSTDNYPAGYVIKNAAGTVTYQEPGASSPPPPPFWPTQTIASGQSLTRTITFGPSHLPEGTAFPAMGKYTFLATFQTEQTGPVTNLGPLDTTAM
jgi:hypothetical protein